MTFPTSFPTPSSSLGRRRPLAWLAGCAATARQDRHVIGYASGNFGKAILLGSIDVTLLFLLTDVAGLGARRASLLMLVVLAGDLVFDIAAGRLAAGAERRGVGYARLVALAAPPCALAFWALYSLPLLRLDEPGAAVLLLALRAAFAAVDVPHNSLLARITTDSHARGRASGYRTLFSSLAAIVVATVIAPAMDVAAGRATPVRMALLGALGGLLFCCSLLASAWSARARRLPGAPAPPPPRTRVVPPVDGLFLAMAAVALVTGFAMPAFVKTLLYVCTYVLQRPALAGHVLLVLAASQVAGAMAWIVLVRHRDKTTLLAASHGIAAAGIVLFALAGNRAGPLLAAAAVIGVGYAGVFMLPWGILADIVDVSEFRHRARHETAWFAVVLVLLKAGGAASLATVGWTLDRLGYVPGAPQPAVVLLGMRGLAFGLPVLGAVAAILVLRRLALGHGLHARVCRINGARRARLARTRQA